MISDSQPRPRAWLVIVLLWVSVFFNYLARLLPTTMHGSLVAAMPMTEAQFGLLTACFFWTYGLMSPVGGFLADRFSRTQVIIASMSLWSVITWLTSYTRTFEQLLVLRSLMGISEACYFPAAVALISDYHKGPTRSLATGIHQTGSMVGIGLSGLGGWLAERSSWHYAFSLVGLGGIAYCVVLALLLRDAPAESPTGTASVGAKIKVRGGEALASLFGQGSFVILFVNAALIGALLWTVFSWMPLFMQEHFNLTQGNAGFSATGCMNAAAIPGLLIGGALADRWSRSNRRGRMFVPAIGLLVAAPGILMTANANVFILATLGLVIYRLFSAFFDANLMPVLCEIVDPRYRATGYGLLNMASTIAAGLGIYFSGVLRDLKVDLHFVFDGVAVAAVFGALLFCLIKSSSAASSPPRFPRN